MQTSKYDYVIVGAGTAGCLLANRLSADPDVKVLLLEAGGRDDWIWIRIPVGYLYCIGNPRTDWCYRTEPEEGLNGRSILYARGRVLGGCSSINAMIYMRGQARDYDEWAQLTGDSGWSWSSVLPVFRQHEDFFRGADEVHGAGGEWRVEPQRLSWEILDTYREAMVQAGIPRSDDFNRGDNEGCGFFLVNQTRGVRLNTSRAFLRPVLNRPNLTVLTEAQAKRLRLEGRRCTGIEIERGGQVEFAAARIETILASGSIGSPQILQLSGVGPPQLLKSHGIEVVHALPGVGENLQDHLQLRMAFKVSNVVTLNRRVHSLFGKAAMALEYALFRSGPLTMAPSQLGGFTRSSAAHATPNVEFHVQPLSLDKFGDPLHPFDAFTSSVCNLRPTSRGHVRIKSADPRAAPAIHCRYLTTDEDRKVAVDSLRLARRVAAQPALAKYRPEEFLPGPQHRSDEELVRAAGDIGTTIFHPVGTCKMGRADDPLAVVDSRLRVRGLAGLRVVDASVMPTITSGNTNSPTLMIAERAAKLIREDRRAA
ncbi:choline dehydrogenase [Betaproteobacteria bacterium PRO7]|nr:GMC family oxidoreductase N-terminal domain-containing protein [Burkholderiaceae bacterium]MDL1861593.1 choline dehydrogenase [Betaproteobacteria bacterium PRO7]